MVCLDLVFFLTGRGWHICPWLLNCWLCSARASWLEASARDGPFVASSEGHGGHEPGPSFTRPIWFLPASIGWRLGAGSPVPSLQSPRLHSTTPHGSLTAETTKPSYSIIVAILEGNSRTYAGCAFAIQILHLLSVQHAVTRQQSPPHATNLPSTYLSSLVLLIIFPTLFFSSSSRRRLVLLLRNRDSVSRNIYGEPTKKLRRIDLLFYFVVTAQII